MTKWIPVVVVVIGISAAVLAVVNTPRYSVGVPIQSSIYTEPFDPCDAIYRFMQTRYGKDPNNLSVQAAPDDWVKAFGNNERTMLFHEVSELRVVLRQLIEKVKEQDKRIAALEPKDPNEGKR